MTQFFLSPEVTVGDLVKWDTSLAGAKKPPSRFQYSIVRYIERNMFLISDSKDNYWVPLHSVTEVITSGEEV